MRRRQIQKARADKKSRLAATIKVEAEAPAETYRRLFGKPPHHRMKPETILEKINDGNTSERSA